MSRIAFGDIPKFSRDGKDQTTVSLAYLEKHLALLNEGDRLDLEPDFQRAHVWDAEKRRAFVEFVLRGGYGSSDIRFNEYPSGKIVLVDGLQRLTAIRMFLRDELRVFPDLAPPAGALLSEFEGESNYRRIPPLTYLIFRMNDLPKRSDVLRWYLEINAGGVVHTEDELAKVRRLHSEALKEEKLLEDPNAFRPDYQGLADSLRKDEHSGGGTQAG